MGNDNQKIINIKIESLLVQVLVILAAVILVASLIGLFYVLFGRANRCARDFTDILAMISGLVGAVIALFMGIHKKFETHIAVLSASLIFLSLLSYFAGRDGNNVIFFALAIGLLTFFGTLLVTRCIAGFDRDMWGIYQTNQWWALALTAMVVAVIVFLMYENASVIANKIGEFIGSWPNRC